jgi:hypothetical protein
MFHQVCSFFSLRFSTWSLAPSVCFLMNFPILYINTKTRVTRHRMDCIFFWTWTTFFFFLFFLLRSWTPHSDFSLFCFSIPPPCVKIQSFSFAKHGDNLIFACTSYESKSKCVRICLVPVMAMNTAGNFLVVLITWANIICCSSYPSFPLARIGLLPLPHPSVASHRWRPQKTRQ